MRSASETLFSAKRRPSAANPAILASTLLFLGCILATQAFADTPVQVVALTGNHAPGTAANDDTFSQFPYAPYYPAAVPPSINANGQVNFYGTVAGPGVFSGLNDQGLWSGTPGNVALVARIDNTHFVPSSGVTFSSFTPPPTLTTYPLVPVPINARNQLAFDAFVGGNGVSMFTDEGLWTGPATNITNFAQEGSQVPGQAAGVQYSPGARFGSPYLNDAGHVAFTGGMTPLGGGIIVGDPAAPQLLAQVGQQAPGLPAGVTFKEQATFGGSPYITLSPVALGANDHVTFTAGLQGGGTTFNFGGIWSGTIGNINLITRIGDQAPGMPTGITLQSQYLSSPFSGIDGNGAGQVVFASDTTNQSFTSAGSGLWAGTAGHLSLVAAGSAQAPGMAAGVKFSTDAFSNYPSNFLPVNPLINAQGQIAFATYVDKPGSSNFHSGFGIWSGSPDHLNLIAQRGQQAPGAPFSNLTFSDFSPIGFGGYPPYPNLAMNGAGQVAFSAALSDTTVGIYGTDRAGQLREVIHVGDTIQVAPGDFRTITALSFLGGSGNADGRPDGLSDNGQIAFWAAYSGKGGGFGMFVSNALAVPEPSSLVLVVLGAIAAGLVARRKAPY